MALTHVEKCDIKQIILKKTTKIGILWHIYDKKKYTLLFKLKNMTISNCLP